MRCSHTQVSSSPGNLRSCRNAAAGWWEQRREPRVSDAKMLIAFVILAAASLAALHVSM